MRTPGKQLYPTRTTFMPADIPAIIIRSQPTKLRPLASDYRADPARIVAWRIDYEGENEGETFERVTPVCHPPHEGDTVFIAVDGGWHCYGYVNVYKTAEEAIEALVYWDTDSWESEQKIAKLSRRKSR